MPVYNPPLDLLDAAINSIKRQIYPHWELCIADDASTNPEVWLLLQRLVLSDKRIRAVRRETNGHISQASNSALALANGEFIALMDNDDVLPPDALYWVAEATVRTPDVQVIYQMRTS
ncbi:glycosyltransferase [Rhodoferax sp. AJA081-3]|uniref:glycosyltransferase n=1 Tax=Rhodoferax sp. AJA081-3 TaxID=2752316 RepID=UPI001AE0DAAB|nr:glycosyltransferase [Rhodoferax sp. AJA081-3]